MINDILNMFAVSFRSVIIWFETVLQAGGALYIFIGGITAVITARYLLLPLVRTSISPSNIRRTRSTKERDNN